MSIPPDLENLPASSPSRHSHGDLALPLSPSVDELAENVSLPAENVVPARHQSTDRMISGIDLIDFGVGGLLPGKVYVVKGETGLGKTVVGLQYLTRGLEQDEPGVLITDQNPEIALTQARLIGFHLDEAVKRGQLTILNPSGRYFELVESPADIQAIVEELADYIQKIGARRLVIDPIHALINTQYSEHFAIMVTQSLLNALEELPTTTLLVAGDDQSAELNPIVRMLEHNAFGVIALERDTATGGRIMSLSKLRYASNDNLSAHYRILNGRGLINYRGENELVDDVTRPWDESSGVNRTVLLLGANPETIRRVQETLGSDYAVQAESDLLRGVVRARKEKPGLVLVTPSRSIAAAGAILDLATNSSSSIAFLSPGTNRKSDRILYLRAGADDFISEPFAADEFRARVDALIRRSGRRLTVRGAGAGTITAQELETLMDGGETSEQEASDRVVLRAEGEKVEFAPEFHDRLQRNLAIVSKFDTPYALYWIKANDDDATLNHSLAKLCREGDILCHNRSGEFVAILTGTDKNGLRGFENRLNEKLGERVGSTRVQRGYELYQPGWQA